MIGWSVAGADAAVVVTLGDVADPVEPVADRPVLSHPGGQQAGIGVAMIREFSA
jgi:hypothetical protein